MLLFAIDVVVLVCRAAAADARGFLGSYFRSVLRGHFFLLFRFFTASTSTDNVSLSVGTSKGVPLTNPFFVFLGLPTKIAAKSFAVIPLAHFANLSSSRTHSAACRSSFFLNNSFASFSEMFVAPSEAMCTNKRKNGSTRAFVHQYPFTSNVFPYVCARNLSNALRYPNPSRLMKTCDPSARNIAVVNRAIVRLLSALFGLLAFALSPDAAIAPNSLSSSNFSSLSAAPACSVSLILRQIYLLSYYSSSESSSFPPRIRSPAFPFLRRRRIFFFNFFASFKEKTRISIRVVVAVYASRRTQQPRDELFRVRAV